MTPKKLRIHILQNTYHITHVRHLLHKWNPNPKVPQKLHVRVASKDTCRKWNKRIILRIEKAKKKDFTVFIQDESVFVDDVRLGKKYQTDVTPKNDCTVERNTPKIFGNDDNQFLDRMKNLMQLHLWIIWKQLVKNLEKYLLSLIEHHKANDVKKYLRKNKNVKLAYLLRSPHLSMAK